MYIVILITAPNKKEAKLIAGRLLKARLAACVNIIDNISSIFWWKAKIDKAKEVLLVIKSKKTKLPKIIRLVRSLHSYDIPEIIALPIIAGNKNYLEWLDESLNK